MIAPRIGDLIQVSEHRDCWQNGAVELRIGDVAIIQRVEELMVDINSKPMGYIVDALRERDGCLIKGAPLAKGLFSN
jgi:hypothetical protein